MSIRLNVAGLIIRDEHILLIECDAPTDLHYNLPGGGVEVGETLHQALQREVREETTAQITKIGDLCIIWEYIPDKLAAAYGPQHKVAHVFFCTLTPDSTPRLPDEPDPHQTGVVWMSLIDLPTAPLLPAIQPQILALVQNPSQVPRIVTLQQPS